MAEYELVNLGEFVRSLTGERHRTFIVHGEPASGKSSYALGFAQQTGGKYLDLLQRFSDDEKLKTRIDMFDIESLKDLLVEEAKGTDLLVLDNPEFLLNTWGEGGKKLLIHLLDRTWDSFKPSYRTALGVFMTTDRTTMDWHLNTSKGETKVFPLKRLEAL